MISLKKEHRKSNLVLTFQTLKKHHHCGWSIFVLILSIFLLSLFSGMNFKTSQRMYKAGDVAETEVIADKELLVEDPRATQERIDQAIFQMPKIYDLTITPYLQFQEKLLQLIRCLNNDKANLTDEDKNLLNNFKEEVTPPLADEILPELAKPEVQNVLIKKLKAGQCTWTLLYLIKT